MGPPGRPVAPRQQGHLIGQFGDELDLDELLRELDSGLVHGEPHEPGLGVPAGHARAVEHADVDRAPEAAAGVALPTVVQVPPPSVE